MRGQGNVQILQKPKRQPNEKRRLRKQDEREAYDEFDMPGLVPEGKHPQHAAHAAAQKAEGEERALRNPAPVTAGEGFVRAHDEKQREVYRRQVHKRGGFRDFGQAHRFFPPFPFDAFFFGLGRAQPGLYSGLPRFSGFSGSGFMRAGAGPDFLPGTEKGRTRQRPS